MMKKVYRPVTSAAFCSVTGVIVLGQWCWWTPIHVCQPIILIRWRTRLIYWHHPCCFRLFPQLQHLSEKWQVRSCCAHPQSQSKAHDDASQYQVWLQKVEQLRRYHPDKITTDRPTQWLQYTILTSLWEEYKKTRPSSTLAWTYFCV